MAHSIQVFDDRAEIFNDSDLLALVCLLGLELDSSGDSYPAAASVVARWQSALAGYGPGTIELGLGGIVASAEEREELVQLLELVDRRVGSYGDTVPALLLNGRCSVPGVIFRDYPGSILAAAIHRLIQVLSEDP